MYIKEVKISNFRLLNDVNVLLDEELTLIVGKNNSGNTSLAELFFKFLKTEKTRFEFEDFSINAHDKFRLALK